MKSAYGVVDVRTDHETITTAISTMVDGNDVAGLFIHSFSFVHCAVMNYGEVEVDVEIE